MEEEEEKPHVSEGKTAKKAARKSRLEEPGARDPFKPAARQSKPRDQLAKPPPKGKTSVAKSMVLRCKLFRRKSNFIVCSDILCARAFLFDDLFAVTLCSTFLDVMHFIAVLC